MNDCSTLGWPVKSLWWAEHTQEPLATEIIWKTDWYKQQLKDAEEYYNVLRQYVLHLRGVRWK